MRKTTKLLNPTVPFVLTKINWGGRWVYLT